MKACPIGAFSTVFGHELLAKAGAGVAMLTEIDVATEIAAGDLVFIPLNDAAVPLSVLSLVTASGRTLSAPASLLLQALAKAMREADQGGIGIN